MATLIKETMMMIIIIVIIIIIIMFIFVLPGRVWVFEGDNWHEGVNLVGGHSEAVFSFSAEFL